MVGRNDIWGCLCSSPLLIKSIHCEQRLFNKGSFYTVASEGFYYGPVDDFGKVEPTGRDVIARHTSRREVLL